MESSLDSRNWSTEKSAELYRLEAWGSPYLRVTDDGGIAVNCRPDKFEQSDFTIDQIVDDLYRQGGKLPAIVRCPDILHHRADRIKAAFQRSISRLSYSGDFQLCYPVKTNQRRNVVRAVRQNGIGLEVGTKAELAIGLDEIKHSSKPLLCNGAKDRLYMDLVIHAAKAGVNAILTIERPEEVQLLIKRFKEHQFCPALGLRICPGTQAEGFWSESTGQCGQFGMHRHELIWAVDELRKHGILHHVKMLHYHLGSQISDLQFIERAAEEVASVYAELIEEGLPLKIVNAGGGIAVNYGGNSENSYYTKNYSLDDYSYRLLSAVSGVCRRDGCPEPVIYIESGRGLAAHHSFVVFELFDRGLPDHPTGLQRGVQHRELATLESYARAPFPRFERVTEAFSVCQSKYRSGLMKLREYARAEKLYSDLCRQSFSTRAPRNLSGNLSIFQSVPDAWGLKQLFPIMPIQRLNEAPVERAKLLDVTCDSDGVFQEYQSALSPEWLPVHPIGPDPYYVAAFHTGAYQETIGDIHNLYGRTSVIRVSCNDDGSHECELDHAGDTVADVMQEVSYLEDVIDEIWAFFGVTGNEEARKAIHQLADGSTYLDLDNRNQP
ncbi:MAG: biosynthetic arginine decarboxylase [Verrucomicrobiales bacterium]|nr:biosynthetic arginine decarboxylase [Verrucomicrobiales bacterium]